MLTAAKGISPPKNVAGSTIHLENVSKSYGTRTVLHEIRFEAEPHEFVAIIGHSGCGKSTLLRLMAGLDAPTSGQVIIDGKRVDGLARTTRMMFQEPRLLPWLNVAANVSVGLKGDARQIASDVLREVNLADRERELPGVLSGGQKQRVALARALAAKPDLLLLDEPLGALDALTRIEMQQLIERVWERQGFTAVLVTHDVEEAVILADTVVVLRDGAVDDVFLVDLPRPRRRNHPRVGEIAQLLLDRLIGSPEGDQAISFRASSNKPRR